MEMSEVRYKLIEKTLENWMEWPPEVVDIWFQKIDQITHFVVYGDPVNFSKKEPAE
ncbi:MAG: hypothetical protein [Caudoviricetes sp.]|nr:MAG: hypothetical protein [Caudoviricetes sp.]